MATKKKLEETEPRIPKPEEIAEGPIPYQYSDMIEPAVVVADRNEMPNPTEEAKTDETIKPAEPKVEQVKPAPAPKFAELETKPVQTPENPYLKLAELQDKSFAQWALGQKEDAEKRIAEDEARIQQENANAKASGFAEFGAALANLIGVGAHNAVSQQYHTFSQDWMKKADADMREHRNRVDDLRQRQRDIELKQNQLKLQGIQAAMEYEKDLAKEKLDNEYRQAQIDYQKARTEAEKQEAEQKMREAEEKIKYIQAQTAAQGALAAQRYASAQERAAKGKSYGSKETTPTAPAAQTETPAAPAATETQQPGFVWDPKNGRNGPQWGKKNQDNKKTEGLTFDENGFPI